MSEWKTYRLGDLCDSISNTYRGKAQNVVLINTSDVLEGKCLNHRKEPNKNLKGQFKKTFQQGDILYSEIRPSNKRFAYIDFDATDYIASTKLMVLRANEKIRPLYLYYILQSQVVIDELHMLAESRSGTFPQITFSELSLLTTELPDIDSQDKIINILKSLDDKIELNRRINANLEAQAQALFINISRTYPTQKGILKDLIEIKYGKDHKKLNVGNIPVYGSGGIMRYVDTSIYEKETVLIPRKGSLNNVIYLNTPFWSVDTMFYSVMKYDHIAKYVYFFLKSKDLSAMNAGSAVPSMTTDILYQMEINIPDKTVFETYDTIVSPLFKQIQVNQEENQSLSALRDTLLPKLMAGEINIENQ